MTDFVPIPNPRSVPAFLNKLYNMVSDKESNHLIRWSVSGESFIVTKPEEFAKEVLPLFFKHNNFSSFVRQLNMYGFHKVPHIQQGLLNNELEHWEFMNDYFKMNRPELLSHVKRKTGKEGEEKDIDAKYLLDELNSIRTQQMVIASELELLRKDNQLLWAESLAARERHIKQEEMINKIVRFLAQVFSTDRRVHEAPKKRRLMIEGNDDSQVFPLRSSLPEITSRLNNTRVSVTDIDDDIDVLESNLKYLTDELGLNSTDLSSIDNGNIDEILGKYQVDEKSDFDISHFLNE